MFCCTEDAETWCADQYSTLYNINKYLIIDSINATADEKMLKYGQVKKVKGETS